MGILGVCSTYLIALFTAIFVIFEIPKNDLFFVIILKMFFFRYLNSNNNVNIQFTIYLKLFSSGYFINFSSIY